MVQAKARQLIADSTFDPVQLVELYTSQSCSSCPPAEARISRLKTRADLWRKFVPVAWHVDYWNQLAWKDSFSSPRYSKRQRSVAQTWARPQVYTPAFVVSGHEWQGWPKETLPTPAKPAKVRLMVFRLGSGEIQIQIEGVDARRKYVVHAARLGMERATQISSGENSGLNLNHDFVVLQDLTSSFDGSAPRQLDFHFAPEGDPKAKSAIAVWIESAEQPIPIQATGGYL